MAKSPEDTIRFRAKAEAATSGVSIMVGLWLILEGFKYNNPDLVKGGIALVSVGAGGALKSWHDFDLSQAVGESGYDLSDPEQLGAFRRERSLEKYNGLGTKIPLDNRDIL